MTRGPVGGPTVAPYGSWRSSIGLDELYAGRQAPSGPQVDGHDLYWLESRPSEGGREVVVRRSPDGSVAEATPVGVNVRTMVHEYGGGAWAVADGLLVYADKADGRLYLLAGSEAPRALTPAGAFRYADLTLDLVRGRVLCIREDHTESDIDARNTLVAVALDGGSAPTELVAGHDFFSAPRLSPDGGRLAWLSWDHPNLPWDGTDLWLAELDASGRPGEPRHVAGGPTDAITQPRWSPEGELHFVAEPDGWWNLYRLGPDGSHVPLARAAIEFGFPDWNFGLHTYDFLSDGRIVAISAGGPDVAHDRLWLIEPETGRGEDRAAGRAKAVEVPYTEMRSVAVLPDDRLVLVAASWTEATLVAIIPLTGGPGEVLHRATNVRIDPGEISVPRPVTFPTTDGALAHGLFYAPRNDRYRGPDAELPPLIVTSHGGPTSAAHTSLALGLQYFTSRGLAVVDVDYRGSSGYGRDYRRALEGNWGVYDIDDCVAAARYLAREGQVDGSRLVIVGGSASGYTTLAALVFRDVFCAGVSYFGIGDLETFVHTTHKFEARYLDRLVGPWPAAAETYAARSPIHHLEGLSCPLLILQGLEDRIVPPSQAERMVEALRANGQPYVYLPFEGEGHGFRSEASLRRSTQAELAFYGRVLGFTPADDLPPLELIGGS